MSKAKLRVKLNEYEDTVNGILINNKIKFLLDKKMVTISINDNNIIMERKYSESEYTYICFDEINPKAYYFYNNKYPLNIEVIKMKKNSNIIEIKYKIEKDIFDFKLEYEGCEL